MLCYKCKYSWNYKGKNSEGKGYITCPGCLYKIRSDRALVEETFKQESLIKLPTKLPKRLPTTNHLKPLEIKVPIEIEEYQEEEIKIREIKSDLNIRIIPTDLFKLVEYQRSFF